MAEARYVTFEILYDGVPQPELADLLESISYTDNASGRSDEISLTFCSRSTDYLIGHLLFEKEHELDVTYFLHNWKRDGDLHRYHCGAFTVDTISFSGSPRVCTVKGISIPAAEAFQTVPASKNWGSVTIRQIAEEMMEKYGMATLHYWGAEPVIERVEQDNQTDSAFLAAMCEKQGLFLKIYKKALVIFDKTIYEANGPSASFSEADFDGNYSWESSLVGTYTGATITYTVPQKKAEQQVIQITVGAGPRMLQINEKADNEAEAERIAKARVNTENEKAVRISFAAMEDPNVLASCNIEWKGMGVMDGKYFVEKVTHNISGSGGSKMKVSGYRIFNRL